MKKIMIALFFLVSTLGFSHANAQQKTTTTKKTAKTTTVKATTATTKTGLKKDGTPDMRYKENKVAKDKPAGPLKKDGTPDMRYKANKPKTTK